MNEIHNRTVVTVPAPHVIGEPFTGCRECTEWCEYTLGPEASWWYMGEGVFEFNDDRDAFIFRLRWQ